jgi:hypothetical protein
LKRRKNTRADGGSDLADAYGSLAMLLHAAEFFDAALPCYLERPDARSV